MSDEHAKGFPAHTELPDHERRLAVARRVARWRLGDGAWADEIIRCYTNPASSKSLLQDIEEHMGRGGGINGA